METIDALVQKLEQLNDAYRRGEPLVGDREYDRLVEALRRLDPKHPFLQTVEPETFAARREVRHPVPMLSTEKAYTRDDLARFTNRVLKEAAALGVDDLRFKVTPKLDGLAGRDDGRVFASRGNGEVGFEISSAFQKGVVPVSGRGRGVGEIVVVKSYFETHLAGAFEHPRNMVVGIVSSDKVNAAARRALQDRMVHFVPYSALPAWIGSADGLLEDIAAISDDLFSRTDYPVDGVVVEVLDEGLKAAMGATTHHHRWQVAFKTKGDTAVTVVQQVTWQVGRTGNVTPVMTVRPVLLSGATIRRVTAHHAGMIREKGIGADAEIEVIRSGEVIPKLEKVITPSARVVIPDRCPSCGRPLVWRNDFLKCSNTACRDQLVQRIVHWFKTLGNADWFGIKTIEKLVDGGFDGLEKIYAMHESDFSDMGFGPVQSKNLAEALTLSRTKKVEDWRFLAALGISELGKGDSRKLLAHMRLEDVMDAGAGAIEQINGFGAISSRAIRDGVKECRDTFRHMLSLGFELIRTPLAGAQDTRNSPIAGRAIVFTGKMAQGSRDEMQAAARNLGARVQSAVSSKTDYLVCGEKVGPAKIEKARRLGIRIVSEAAYRAMIDQPGDAD